MNSVTYSIRGTTQIDLNGRDNKGRSVRKCTCQIHEAWSHSSLYHLLNMKKRRFRKVEVLFDIHKNCFPGNIKTI